MVIGIVRIADLNGLSTISVLFFLPLVAGITALLMKNRPTAKSERIVTR